MASGHYDSPTSEADEDASNTGRFFIATTHAEKIQFACTHYPRKDAPGKRWVYHTTDTYILGAALAAWWRKRKGRTRISTATCSSAGVSSGSASARKSRRRGGRWTRPRSLHGLGTGAAPR